MTSDEKLEAIWEHQRLDAYDQRHPILYERCDKKRLGWRLYFWSEVGGGDAIVGEGSPTLREAINKAYAHLFPQKDETPTCLSAVTDSLAPPGIKWTKS